MHKLRMFSSLEGVKESLLLGPGLDASVEIDQSSCPTSAFHINFWSGADPLL